MAEIRFYHLVNSSAYQAMPMLLQKASDMGITGVVLVPRNMMTKMSDALWQGGEKTNFIAHDVGDGESDAPFRLLSSTDGEGVQTLFAVDDVPSTLVEKVNLVCYMFNGLDMSVLGNARKIWRTLTENKDNTVAYYKQTESGGWVKKH